LAHRCHMLSHLDFQC